MRVDEWVLGMANKDGRR